MSCFDVECDQGRGLAEWPLYAVTRSSYPHAMGGIRFAAWSTLVTGAIASAIMTGCVAANTGPSGTSAGSPTAPTRSRVEPAASESPVRDIQSILSSSGQRGHYGSVILDARGTGRTTFTLPAMTGVPTVALFLSCAPSSSFTVIVDDLDLFGGGSCNALLVSDESPVTLSRFDSVTVDIDHDVSFELLVLEGKGK